MSGIGDTFSRVVQAVQEVIAAPMANLGAAMLLLAALALLLLIVVVVLALLILPSPKKPPRAREPIKRPRRRSRGRIRAGTWVVVAAVVMAAVVGGYVGTSRDEYCLSCHDATNFSATQRQASSVPSTGTASQIHTGVRCVSCHDERLPVGLASNLSSRLRWAVKGFTGANPDAGEASVPARRCLACHRAILSRSTESTESGIVMSHKEPVLAGAPCTDCHKNAGHKQGPQGVSMNTCLRCHDGKNAAADCGECHKKDTAFAARERRTFSFVHLPPITDCGGCHDQKVCDACHGLRMPHPQDFLAGEHARYAGFEKKNLCWRCHTLADCGRCHSVKAPGLGAWGHGTGNWWRYEHGRVTPKGAQAGCGCHGSSPYARAGNYCKACH